MKAVIQRVSSASVTVGGEVKGRIEAGILLLLGVEKGDTEADAKAFAAKISGMRIFNDEAGKMNLDVKAVRGAALVISQFTLLADLSRGRRPSFEAAEAPEAAKRLYEFFMEEMKGQGVPVERGEFGAHMEVELVNDGPVTIIINSKEL